MFSLEGAENCGSKTLIFEMRIWNPYSMEGVDNGVAVYGSEGMVQIGRWAGKSGFKVFDRKDQEPLFDNTNEPDAHACNFIDCIRSRQTPNAEIKQGHISTTYAHLANLVARAGRQLKFDAKTETIVGAGEANRYLKRQYRKHWAAPRDGARIT